MPNVKPETSNKLVQTTIHCFPHILLSKEELAKVNCDRSSQTAATTTPNTSNTNIYALLEFIPYQVISEGAIKELDLPRRALLQWKLPSSNGSQEVCLSPEREESEIHKQRGVLKKSNSNTTSIISFGRLLAHHHYIMQKAVTDQEAQTVLTVLPHVLESDEVANVYTELSIQTSITCAPTESISNILPQLKANLSHTSISTETSLRGQHNSSNTSHYISSKETKKMNATTNTKKATNHCENSCECGTQLINKIANKMRVHASTLKLTPKVFPPNVKFEDRMMEVLNTTIAILQTEMAKLIEVYITDDMPCTQSPSTMAKATETAEKNSESEIQNTSFDVTPPSKESQNQPDSYDPPPGQSNTLPSVDSTNSQSQNNTIGPTDQSKENSPSTSSVPSEANQDQCALVTPSSEQLKENVSAFPSTDLLEEKFPFPTRYAPTGTQVLLALPTKLYIEHCFRKNVLNAEQRTVLGRAFSDPVVSKFLKKVSSHSLHSSTKQMKTNTAITGSNCETIVNGKILKTTFTAAPSDTSSNGSLTIKLLSQSQPRVHTQSRSTSQPLLDETTPPSELSNIDGDNTEDDTLMEELVYTNEAISYASGSSQLPGDHLENKRLISIPCECCPKEAGAAPPTLCTEEKQSFMDKVVNLEYLMKNNIKDMESVSASTAIVVRATLSSPDTNKKRKENVQIRFSLPDLREQVIRLSVIHPTGTTELEHRNEELLTSSPPIHIIPSKSSSFCVDRKPLSLPMAFSCPTTPISLLNSSILCECGRLACTRRLSLTTTEQIKDDKSPNKCCCFDKHVRENPHQLSCRKMPCYSNSTQPTVPLCAVSSSVQVPVQCISSHYCNTPSSVPLTTSTPPDNFRHIEETTDPDLEKAIAISLEEDNQYSSKALTLTYQEETFYDELYMQSLTDEDELTTAVQTDLTLGDKLESESLNSLTKDEEMECTSKTEMPWRNITLLTPGSYSIKPKEKVLEKDECRRKGEASGTDEGVGRKIEVGVITTGNTAKGGGRRNLYKTTLAGRELPPPAEPQSCKQRQNLIFEDYSPKYNEPYMEGLFKVFPNSDENDDDSNCGSHTEMPWKDIILPENCRIRKTKEYKDSTCPSKSQQLTDMLLPARVSPKELQENKETSVVELHIGFEKPASDIFSIDELRRTVSACSTISNFNKKPKRSPKEYTMSVGVEKDSISFKVGQDIPPQVSVSSAVHPSSSQPLQITTYPDTQANFSSAIVTIKPSTDCPYQSTKLPVAEEKQSILISMVNPSVYVGSVPAGTRSCTATSQSKMCNRGNMKNVSSMPQIPNQRCISATVSVKKLDEPDKPVNEKKFLSPGDSNSPLKIEPVNLKSFIPDNPPKEASAVHAFLSDGCSCRDHAKPDNCKQDPVTTALKAYEAEMKPLRRALTELQEKIRNLNMPEMKSCLCSSLLSPKEPITTQSKVEIRTDSGFSTKTAFHIKPIQTRTCTYLRSDSLYAPVPQPLPFGYLPPPMLSPYRSTRSTPSPNCMTPSIPQVLPCCCGGRRRNSSYGSQHSYPKSIGCSRQGQRQSSEYRGIYGKEDICMYTNCYGMYPNHRRRAYPDNRVTYHGAYGESSNKKRHQRKYKTQRALSIPSSEEISPEYDSQYESDPEESLTEYKRGCRRCKEKDVHSRHRKSHSSKYGSKSSNFENCMPCRDSQHLRPGQALKTSPDEFLSFKQLHRAAGVPRTDSKNKIHIKLPYR